MRRIIIFIIGLFLIGCSQSKIEPSEKMYQITTKCGSEESLFVKSIIEKQIRIAFKDETDIVKAVMSVSFDIDYERTDRILESIKTELVKHKNPYSLSCDSERYVSIMIGERWSHSEPWYDCKKATDEMAINRCSEVKK